MICVSVIVPFYKVTAADFARCVAALKAQTLKSVEFIFVDDRGPDDAPRQLLAAASAGDSRFRLLTQDENGGVSAARNRGLEAAAGLYVCFVDADDCVTPDFLEKLYSASGAGAADAVFSNIRLVDRGGMTTGILGDFTGIPLCELSDPALARLCRRMPWTVMAKLFRRQNSRRFDQAMFFGEDKDFTARTLPGVRRFAAVGEAMYHYYVGSDNSVMKKTVFSPPVVDQIFRFCRTLKRAVRELPADWTLSRAVLGRELFDASLVRGAVNRNALSPEVRRQWERCAAELWSDVSAADGLFPPALSLLLSSAVRRRPAALFAFFRPLFLLFRLWWKFRLDRRLAEKYPE
ncbi:MAG: glycosyltransferase family 2 protein [Victivallaceae bacterium]|nr:glycosyltransferase family 2 protein [Victivallaceae bacterium]